MAENKEKGPSTKEASEKSFQVTAPTISLPKGGGAIHGIGEKFAANPVTGTGSMTVPIATSPGRSGFGPQLSLSYDSGAGNGPFGLGWSLSLPAITRKTDKGLPQYNDADESDVFILSGSEDLVPEFEKDASGQWVFENGKHVLYDKPRTVNGKTYQIRRYRPRIEGLFARIERWSNVADLSDVHWRSISKDNILTLYGKDNNSRITDPENAAHIFSWLICETRDDKGNGVLYEYKAEDGIGVDLLKAHERNRGDKTDLRRTANRYLKRIKYGNRTTLLDQNGQRLPFLTLTQQQNAVWMFEAVLDYGEHHADVPKPDDVGPWTFRNDPFSTYRSGFEVRTTRLCQRVLMFHHIPDLPTGEAGYEGLMRSTDFEYSYESHPADARNPIYSQLIAVTQTGYNKEGAGYLKRSLPPVEFEYTQPKIQETVEEVDVESLENLPIGVDGSSYQWIDLHGEGIPGILTEQNSTWYYKRNLSPIGEKPVQFSKMEVVALKPNLAVAGGQARFMDLAGDGQPDLAVLDGPMPGLYEHDEAEGWEPFRPFTSRLNRDMRDPNLKFVDLDGDGHADVLITEQDAMVWHPSLAEGGFGEARRVAKALDEEKGPRLVFADGEQSIYLADLSGDGLTDLVRTRNGEVCYWPNLGYGRFGAKVSMDQAPWFDHPDYFDPKRVRLADIDGTGTTDIIYLHRDGVRLFFNQSGNAWSHPSILTNFPRVDDVTSIMPTDLLGNGTACLVWSSPLPADAPRSMRYVNLMGRHKPHLLVKTVNNLGAEIHVQYAASTKFYLQDKRDEKPWITKLPFPVHVVERIETYDRISRNRFVSSYKYHHGYFDGIEREFRGFGRVDQIDTEQFAALTESDNFAIGDNIDAASHVPPVLTKTWFHTGAYLGSDRVSNFFAGLVDDQDRGEYYREPGLTDVQAEKLLLDDTVLPEDLFPEEEREACRALKGSMLRQEVYALDGSDKEGHPYTVTEQNFSVYALQPQSVNRHAVFFTHARAEISYHHERIPDDPRTQHALTLEVDDFGNVLKSVAIGYGRRPGQSSLVWDDKKKQEQLLMTYTESDVTNPVDEAAFPDDYRAPLSSEVRTYEVTGFAPAQEARRFVFKDLSNNSVQSLTALQEIQYEDPTDHSIKQKRLIERVRTLYRKNDLTRFLAKDRLESMALQGEAYKLAFTKGLLDKIYVRGGLNLLPGNPAEVLEGSGPDRGGYITLDGDGKWWIPSGRSFFTTNPADNATTELTQAQQHFFLPRRYRDPFSQDASVDFDAHDLLMTETRDALGNGVMVNVYDYRVLQPHLVSDPNRNRTEAAFDALGMVVGTAVMGKPSPAAVEGDSLAGFVADVRQTEIGNFFSAADPHGSSPSLLKDATTRIIYDLDRFKITGEPPFAATLVREKHVSDLQAGQPTKIQISFSYSDGFGREIQKKIQAEPGTLSEGGPLVNPRWVGSGWTIFNNKGKPVRQYEPFFTDRHQFEFDVKIGVSPVLFYDPVGRVVATLHPNHTWEKVVFDPWQQTTHDVNDTVLVADPKADVDVGDFFSRLANADYLPTWHALRSDAANAAAFATRYPDATDRTNETRAAEKTRVHAATPTVAHADSLGRTFLTVAHNKFRHSDTPLADPSVEEFYRTRIILDIEGNQREVIDAKERVVMHYDYDMLGNRIHQASMEAGERWMLNDVAGKSISAWDSRGHTFRTEYDPLRRPLRSFVIGADPANSNRELLTDRLVYGEQHPDTMRNLRGKLYLHLDQAGAVTTEAHDFKGNPLRASRRLTNGTQYRQVMDWRAVDVDHVALPTDAKALLAPGALEAAIAPRLEADTYTSRTRFDALNRPVQMIAPRSDQPGAKRNVIQPIFNEANLLDRVHVWLDHPTDPAGVLNTAVVQPSIVGVNNIDYDAKGQRLRIEYKNGVTTRYAYDRETFRLIHLYTRRGATFTEDCQNPQPPPPMIASPDVPLPGIPCGLQNLHYTYDPVGNISHIRDDAQQIIYFKNNRVEPSAEYTYDAIYRLIEATGREHLGQVDGTPLPHSHNDVLRAGTRWSDNDGKAMGTYIERYAYDAVGNFQEVRHRGSDPVHPGWTRTYAYSETSLIEDGSGGIPLKKSNRLSSTKVGANPVERYGHDTHGNMLHMPQLQIMQWDYKNQLNMTQRQKVDDEDVDGVKRQGERTYYVYDAAGQRVRKISELANGNLKDERIYLGGFEIYRQHSGTNAGLVRESLHIMDDMQRIALVETRYEVDDGTLQQVIRYQFGNHLGSASLDLDDQAQIISYEEYTPYGSSSYQAVRSQTETVKRYRYTGKERDEESGLYYHGARYYAAWLGRWASCDQAEMRDGPNLFAYVSNDPVNKLDQNGKWKVNWKHVAIGAGVAVVTIGIVALTAGAAAPVAVPFIAGVLGVSEATVVTGAVVVGTAVGVKSTTTTVNELVTGKDASSGKDLTDEEASQRLGALPIEAAATLLGVRNIKIKPGGGPTIRLPTLEPATVGVPSGGGSTSIRLPGVTAPPQSLPIGAGAGATVATTPILMSMSSSSGGGGEKKSDNDDSGKKPEAKKTEPQSVDKANIKPGMELDPTKSKVFRGGKDLTLKSGEVKVDPTTGLVKSSHGPSLDVNAATVEKFGGAHQIKSIPSELKILQRGGRLEHFEIVPKEPMAMDKFQQLLNQVQFY